MPRRQAGSGLIALLIAVGITAVLAVVIYSSLGGSTIPKALPGVPTATATASTAAPPTTGVAEALHAADKPACGADTAALRAAEEESLLIAGHYTTVAGLVSSGLLARPSTFHDVPASSLTSGTYQILTVGPAGTSTRCGPGATSVTDGTNGAF